MIVTDLRNEFYPIPKTKGKEKPKETKEIKKKSSKLAKAEKNRFSIITNKLDRCYVCGNKKVDLHEVFEGKNRQMSMKYGLVIPVCRECHELIPKNKTLRENLHQVAQKAFEKKYKTENFIKVFGKNYL